MEGASDTLQECSTKVEECEKNVATVLSEIRKSIGSLCEIDDFGEEEEAVVQDKKSKVFRQISHGRLKEIAHEGMSKSEDKNWREQFEELDKDGSGKVSIGELTILLEKKRDKKIPEAEMVQIMKDFDLNADGQLDYDEFLVLVACTDEEKKERFQARAKYAIRSMTTSALSKQERIQKVHLTGIPKSHITRYLRKELDESSACLQLPWAAAIFIFFGISVMLHFRFDVLYAIDEAITFDIEENANFAFSGIIPYENGRMGHKTLYDVNSIADFWSWMSIGLVPLFWPQSWDANEARSNVAMACTDVKSAMTGYVPSQSLNFTPGPAAISGSCPESGISWSQDAERFFNQRKLDGRYLIHSSIIGGARMRQERVPAQACSVTNEDGRVHAGLCHPATLGYWLDQEFNRLLKVDKKYENAPGGETVYLLSRTDQNDLRQQVHALEDRQWFSPETAKIEILFTTFLPRLNVLSATYIYFVLNEAGHIYKTVEPFSFFLDPYPSVGHYVVDIIWLLLTLKLFFEESLEIWKHIKQLGCLKGVWEYIDVANAVDWFSIIYAFVLIALWVISCQELTGITDIMRQGNPTLAGTWSDPKLREDFFEKVHEATQSTVNLRIMLSVYPFVIVSRFFKAFSAQDRLAMVTETLSRAFVDVFHFFVVFSCVFLVYTLSALILWGGEKEYFANFARTVNSVFRLMLGDFDWEELHGVGRVQAVVWFWSFTWLVNFIMLNMLLAIIMDVYTEVKGGIANAPTLWDQAYDMYRREKLVRQGKATNLKTVLTMLDPTDLDEDDNEEEDEETIKVETLTKEYGLKVKQAEEILLEAHRLAEKDAKNDEQKMSDHRVMSRIETKVVQIHYFLEAWVRSNEHGRSRRHNGPGLAEIKEMEL